MQDKPENLSREYILPDGRSVTVGDQLFRAPEALFAPREVEAQGPGVVGMVLRSLARCSSRIQLDILRNVVLSGGSTLFQGFKERLLKDLQAAIPSIAPVKIFSPENRILTAFRNMWITREDYYEVGEHKVKDI
uniref:Uncharacterized protein n=1 Tax=Anas platyrhynchos TaxID=8839 RepID=A0A8B9TI68_ANAPL